MLPFPALREAQRELLDYRGTGMSLIETSHRSAEYGEVHRATLDLLRRLLDVPERHHVLLLAGGATLQFAMVPLNLLAPDRRCDFAITGAWSRRACDDAARVGRARVVWDGRDGGARRLPDPARLDVAPDAAYLQITSNETIDGVQWHVWPEAGDVPLVCDMSSDLLSRRIPVERFGLIFASAQKNAGPSGVTVVILRDDVLERCARGLPSWLGYRTHVEHGSHYGTPPVFAVWLMKLTLEWLEREGGVAEAERRAAARADLVYGVIDRHDAFYRCPVDRSCRSRMNVVFRLPDARLEQRFLAEAAGCGLHGLAGHRTAGGCRASLYNAMPLEGAEALATFMDGFARRHG